MSFYCLPLDGSVECWEALCFESFLVLSRLDVVLFRKKFFFFTSCKNGSINLYYY